MKEMLCKLFTPKGPSSQPSRLSATMAELESISTEMRSLAKTINANQTLFTCISVVVYDEVHPSHPPVMLWLCRSFAPNPDTNRSPTTHYIHSLSDLRNKEKMLGIHTEDRDLFNHFFEATQQLNARAHRACKAYFEPHQHS